MTTNRYEILQNVDTTLKGINGTPGGYQLLVRSTSVYRVLKKHGDISPDEMPALCWFPAPQQQTPVNHPFGQIRKQLDIVVIGHVAEDDDAEKGRLLSAIESDVRRALMTDPRRGGWAISTEESAGESTDEGVPDREAYTGGGPGVEGAASIVLTFRVTYYPND